MTSNGRVYGLLLFDGLRGIINLLEIYRHIDVPPSLIYFEMKLER